MKKKRRDDEQSECSRRLEDFDDSRSLIGGFMANEQYTENRMKEQYS